MDGIAAAARALRVGERRWTLIGGGLSLVVHLLLAALIVVGLPWNASRRPLDEVIVPVEFVEFAPAPTTARPEPRPDPRPEPRPAPSPRPAEAAMPIAERSQAGAVPPPPREKPAVRADPAETTRPRLVAMPRVKPKPPSRFDPARMAALIDRAKKTTTPPAARPPQDAKTAERRAEATAPPPIADRIARASLQAALSAKVQNCWIPPTGAKGVETMRVTLRISLARDGRVIGMPRFVGAEAGRVRSDPFYRIFAESARRAVLNCAPYDDLPAALYRLWREIDFRFDARRMYGGG